jgi:hypothetical protein
MITVKVIRNRNGEAVRRADVYISTHGIASGVRDGRTNDDGEVHIDFSLPCSGKIVVDGQKVYEGDMRAYMPVYI